METDRQPLATPEDLKPLMMRALNVDFMLPIFQRELPALTHAPIQVRACKARAGKARSALQQRKLRVTYRVVVELAGGQLRPYDLWGTLPVTPAFLSPQLLAYCQTASGHPAVTPFERLATYIPELQLGVQFLPVDVALPALIEATRPEGSRLVAAFLPECQNGAVLEQSHSELLHYKPGNRSVLKFTLQLSGGAAGNHLQRVVFGKFFADDRGADIYCDMQTLWDVTCRSSCLRIPEPLGYDAQRRLLVMAEAPGAQDLHVWVKCLEKQQPLPAGVDLSRLERCMGVVAEALRELHQSGIRPRESRTFRDALTDAHRDLALMRHAHPELAQGIKRVLERLQTCMPPDEQLVPCHGGFRHKQLMGNDEYLTMLDWDGLTLAHPALDAANFLCRLRHEPLTEPGKAQELEWLAAVFRHAFLTCEPEVLPRHLALYEALVLIDLALRALRRPRRQEHVVTHIQRLVAEATRLLDRREDMV